MLIYDKIVVDMTKPLGSGTFAVIEAQAREYTGPVAFAKKGRQQAAQAAGAANTVGNKAQGISDTSKGLQAGYRAGSDADASTYFGAPTGPNGLSRFTNTQYENTKRQNAMDATNDIAVGEKKLAQRGLNASTGAESSLINTTNRNKDIADTGAYNEAVNRQLGLGLEGIQYKQQQQQLYDPLRGLQVATGAYGTGANAAAQRNRMGSGIGDIGAGLAGIAAFA